MTTSAFPQVTPNPDLFVPIGIPDGMGTSSRIPSRKGSRETLRDGIGMTLLLTNKINAEKGSR